MMVWEVEKSQITGLHASTPETYQALWVGPSVQHRLASGCSLIDAMMNYRPGAPPECAQASRSDPPSVISEVRSV